MSRTALLGLFLLALGIVLLVRWNSPGGREGERVLERPPPAAAEREAPVLTSPVVPEESRATIVRSPAASTEEIPLLAGPLELPVHVTDPEGRPLADASVSVFADQTESAALFAGKTDGNGMCRIPAADQPWLARIEHAGFGHRHVWIQGADPLEVELVRAVRLAGRVRDAVTGVAVAGATIQWQTQQDGCEECYPEPVVSDVRGNYAIAELEQTSEPARFWIEAEGYPRSHDAFMTAGKELALAHDFELRPGLEVAGVVLDHATGAPLEGASIGEQGGWATSDGAGRFRLLAGGTGTSTLYVELAGYCGVQVPVALEAREPVQIRLVKGTTLAGRVHDAAGRALAGAKIRAAARPQENRGLPRELGMPPEWQWYAHEDFLRAESDADGNFTLAGVMPHQEQQYVSAILTGYRSASLRFATGAPGETRSCELVLEPESSTGTIHGRLTLNGKPARATVHWHGPTREGFTWARDGEYRLGHVEPGRVALSVRLDGSTALRDPHGGHEAEVEVTPGAELEQDFALALPVAEISGSVRFEDGTPARGLDVEIMGGRSESKATTGEDGRYACEVPLQERSYMVVVRFGGQPFSQRGVAAGTSGVDFVLPLFGELRYRAIEAGTELAVPHPWAHWRRPGEEYFRWLGDPTLAPDASGWLHAPVPLGPIELLASTDNHHWAFATGVVVGPDTEHVFELEPGRTLVFELDPASGAWPADHALVVVEPEAAPSIAARVSPDGQCQWKYGDRFAPGTLERRRLDFAANARVSLSGLVGRQLLLVFPDDLVLEPAELEVDGARPDPITVRWRRR